MSAASQRLTNWVAAVVLATIVVAALGTPVRVPLGRLIGGWWRPSLRGSVKPSWRADWFRRFDHWLLIQRPALWATRAHVFLPATLTLGVSLLLLAIILVETFSPQGWTATKLGDSLGPILSMLAILTFLSLNSIYWLIALRTHRISVARREELRSVVSWFVLVNVPTPFVVPLASQLLLTEDGISNAIASAFVASFFVVSLIVPAALSANFVRWPAALLGIGGGLAAIFVPVVIGRLVLTSVDSPDSPIWITVIYLLLLAIWAVAHRNAVHRARLGVSNPARMGVVLALVAAIGPCVIGMTALFSTIVVMEKMRLGGGWQDVILAPVLAISVFLSFWFLMPTWTAVARVSFAPAVE